MKRLLFGILLIMTAFVVSCMLVSCGDSKEPERKTLEYEYPVATFVSSFNKGDSNTMLSCFTAGAREEYSQSGKDIVSELSQSVSDAFGGASALSYELDSKTELSQDEIDALKSEYNSRYAMRLDIKKAYRVTVVFKPVGLNASGAQCTLSVITVKTDSGWCIYGEIINKLKAHP